MQVRTPSAQHSVMIEAVENHMPQVIIVDEMGTELEAAAARTIAERGVQLIATAHGNTLENLLVNPTLSDLVGGVQTVTLGDEEARRRRTQKTILERKAPPTFDVLVEIQSWDKVAVHSDVARTVDAVLRGRPVTPEIRELSESGTVRKSWQRPTAPPEFEVAPFSDASQHRRRDEDVHANGTSPERASHRDYDEAKPVEVASPIKRVHPFGVSRERLWQAAANAGLRVAVTVSVDDADLVLTTKAHYRQRGGVLQAAEAKGIPVFVLRRNTPGQIIGFLHQISHDNGDEGSVSIETARSEAERGVERILNGDTGLVELQPQSSFVRRVQHQIAEDAKLRSHSAGKDPQRRVTIKRAGRS